MATKAAQVLRLLEKTNPKTKTGSNPKCRCGENLIKISTAKMIPIIAATEKKVSLIAIGKLSV